MNQDFTNASPIYWNARQIERVCHSSRDAETLVFNRLVEDRVFAGRQIKTLFGEYESRIPIHLFTDLEGSLKSIASIKQVDRKCLLMLIQNLKNS